MFSNKQFGGKQEKSEILSISNKYKNILDDFFDSLDIEHLTIPRQIDLPSNDIPSSKDDSSDPKMDDDFLNKS